MKTKIIYLVLLMLFAGLSSCVTYKRCTAKFPPSHDTIKIVTVKDSIIFRDTSIFIHIPGATVIDSVIIPCPPPPAGYVPKKVTAETSLAKASAWWSYPVIKLELIQKDTTIIQRLDNAIKESYHWQSEYEKIVTTLKPEKYIPGFYKFCTFVLIGIALAGIGYVLLRLFVFKK